MDLAQSLSLEWLETDGLGGYASSTAAGLATRRYHGLLNAAVNPPVGRMVLLSKLEESLVVDGSRHDLGTNRFPGTVHPHGYRYLAEFRKDPFPTFVYEIGGVRLVKTLFLTHGSATLVVDYRLEGHCASAELFVRPLVAFRDQHALTHENGSLDGRLSVENGLVSITPYAGLPTLFFAHSGAALDGAGYWYRGFEYSEEHARGFDFREDLYGPFELKLDLSNRRAALVVSTERRAAADAEALRAAELVRREGLASRSDDPFTRALLLAADQFLVSRGPLTTVIAGYPWFGDWGRDTMISLPGLAIATGRHDVARQVLLAFAKHADGGMLPNRFPDSGEEPEYNTVDATLWYFEAVRQLVAESGDGAWVRENLYELLVEIVRRHVEGTRYGIHVDADGLLAAGAEGVQLTWMDARVGERVITPRRGKPVEIQALFHNALRTLQDLASRFGDATTAEWCDGLARRAAESFNARFWFEAGRYLYDVVDSPDVKDLSGNDPSLRPNQVFAVSLHHSMLGFERAEAVLKTVRRELLTPVGLRTLSPNDPRYCPRYEGGPEVRDAAYHQGTVWPWLLGPYVSALLRVRGRSKEARAEALEALAGLERSVLGAGAGQIAEIYDADEPRHPRGCFAQAWSVAEPLRVLLDELG